jgi:hypothetical protein
VEGEAADELHVEVPHVQDAAAGLAHHREGLGQQVVERRALGHPLPEGGGLAPQIVVRQRQERRLLLVDALDERTDGLELALVLGPDDLGEDGVQHDRLDPTEYHPVRA